MNKNATAENMGGKYKKSTEETKSIYFDKHVFDKHVYKTIIGTIKVAAGVTTVAFCGMAASLGEGVDVLQYAGTGALGIGIVASGAKDVYSGLTEQDL